MMNRLYRPLRNRTRFLVASSLTSFPITNEGGFDFPDVVDDINTVPEKARGLYTEKDGKYTYTGVDGLKSALSSTRAERDAANARAKKVAGYEALGKSPDEIKALLDQESQREQDRLTQEGDWNALKTQMEQNHTNAIQEKEKRISKLQTTLEREMIDSRLQSVLSDKDVEGDSLFLLPHMRGRVKLEETDNGFNTVVLREDGSPLLNAQNQPASLKDLALEYKGKEQFGRAFKGLNQSGGGGTGGGNGGPGGSTKKKTEMSALEKTRFIREHGIQAYNQLQG